MLHLSSMNWQPSLTTPPLHAATGVGTLLPSLQQPLLNLQPIWNHGVRHRMVATLKMESSGRSMEREGGGHGRGKDAGEGAGKRGAREKRRGRGTTSVAPP